MDREDVEIIIQVEVQKPGEWIPYDQKIRLELTCKLPLLASNHIDFGDSIDWMVLSLLDKFRERLAAEKEE